MKPALALVLNKQHQEGQGEGGPAPMARAWPSEGLIIYGNTHGSLKNSASVVCLHSIIDEEHGFSLGEALPIFSKNKSRAAAPCPETEIKI